jgi:hypothetical protein
MTDDKRGWRALPPVLAAAVLLQLVALVANVIWHLAEPGEKWFARTMLTEAGIHLAADVLAVYGVYELVRRTTGRARIALQIATVSLAIGTLVGVGFEWLFTLWSPSSEGSFEKALLAMRYTSFGLDAVGAAGLAIAAWDKLPFAIGGLVLAVFGHPPPIVYDKLAAAFGTELHGYFKIQLVTQGAYAIGFALLAIAATTVVGTPETRRAVSGLRQVGGALKLRVVAALVGTGLLLLVMMAKTPGEGSVGVIKLALMSAAVLNLVAQLILSFGAMSAASAELTDLPRWAMVVASALSLWAAGVMLAQLPHVYEMLYGRGDHDFGENYAEALATALPIVVTAVIAVVAGAIGALAARRGDNELRTHASGKGVGCVALMLSSIGITAWLLPEAKSESGLLMIMFCAAGTGLWAMVLGARLCSLGADAIEAEPGLPSAKLVS